MGVLRVLIVLYMLIYITIYFGLVGAIVYLRTTFLRDYKYVKLRYLDNFILSPKTPISTLASKRYFVRKYNS